jgi:hypothetical protein
LRAAEREFFRAAFQEERETADESVSPWSSLE